MSNHNVRNNSSNSGESKAPAKRGEKKGDLSGENTAQLLKWVKRMIYVDYGGKADRVGLIQRKLLKHGIKAGPRSCQAIMALLEDVAAGCRKRTFPRLDEAIRRLGEADPLEEMP